jgi:uncharacterized protein DUF5077
MNQILLIMALAAAGLAGETQPTTRPATRPVRQADDGTILLHARDVTIHGTTVRYEPQPNKNTIGYWTRKEDWVSWDFEVTHGGQFEMIVLQGCGKGSGESEVAFTIGDQTLKTTVQDTGGFQNFVERKIGAVELKPGMQTLAVKPLTKQGLAVMDLRWVTLRPITR